MAVILETSLGDITVDLYTNERPRCCLNFLKLCKIKYYNFCLFHSVQQNLVAQTGDPTGTSKGGESVFGKIYGDQAKCFEAEFQPRIKHKKHGTLSMTNNGDNMHGSQFFLTLAPDVDYLDNQHTVFGEVAEGFEALQKLNEAFVDKDHRPYQDIRILHTVVLDDPFDDPDGLSALIPDRSPQPTKEQLESGRIGIDEEIDDLKGKSTEEIEELIADKEAKARTQILEMIGDIPDEDVAPPDNVLFVCKLNQVTTDEDLEIIFSRFGDIASCEVIKDQKSGESLQYAFIEFEKPADCESAYFKMDNVLIDDRRIHVDFSQSVAKLKWNGKGKGVIHEKDSAHKPQLVIKDKSKKNDYEFVFDEETTTSKSNKKHKDKKDKKHKKKKKKSKHSESEEERPAKKSKHDTSSHSRDARYSRDDFDRHRTERHQDHSRRDRSRDRYRDRSSERDISHRDKYR